jgi:hypothetical protein
MVLDFALERYSCHEILRRISYHATRSYFHIYQRIHLEQRHNLHILTQSKTHPCLRKSLKLELSLQSRAILGERPSSTL